jgi:hypothetical protein
VRCSHRQRWELRQPISTGGDSGHEPLEWFRIPDDSEHGRVSDTQSGRARHYRTLRLVLPRIVWRGLPQATPARQELGYVLVCELPRFSL